MPYNRAAFISLLGFAAVTLILFGVNPILIIIISSIFVVIFILLQALINVIIFLNNKDIEKKTSDYAIKVGSIGEKLNKRVLVR